MLIFLAILTDKHFVNIIKKAIYVFFIRDMKRIIKLNTKTKEFVRAKTKVLFRVRV